MQVRGRWTAFPASAVTSARDGSLRMVGIDSVVADAEGVQAITLR
jgi:hypothetical protein